MLQSLLKQINLFNCTLFTIIVVFIVFAILPLFNAEVQIPSNVPPKTADQKKDQAAEQAVHPPAQEYAAIAEHNLFHPDRIIPVEKKAEMVVPRPDFILYGTLIADNVSIAYMSDKKAPRSTPGRGKRQNALKIGEALSGYMLKQVLPDRVVMVRGDDRIEVKVLDPGGKKERVAETTAPMHQAIPMTPASQTMTKTRASATPAGIPTTQPGTTVGGAMSASPQPTAGATPIPGTTASQPPGFPSGPPPGQPLQPSGPLGPTGPVYYQPGLRRAAPGQ